MKKTKRIIAVVLAVLVMASCLCVTAFADGEETNVLAKYAEGTGYVALGDSFTRGYGAGATEDENDKTWLYETIRMDDTKNSECRNVTGSFPLKIAEEIGCATPDEITEKTATYWPIAQNAVTTAFILDLLGIDDGFCDTDYIYYTGEDSVWEQGALNSRYLTDLDYFGDPESYAFGSNEKYGAVGSAMSIREIINNASLISVQLGMGDVIQRAQILGLKGVDLSNIEEMAVGVEKTVALMYEGFEYWKSAYPLVLNYIKENNSDCTVILIGAANPLSNIIISEEAYVPVGTALTVITGLMNQCYAEWAKEYGFIYADINNVEFPAEVEDITFSKYLAAEAEDQGKMGHPTPNGYSQIARIIVNALKEKDAAEQAAKTTVKVELGRFKRVDYVLVDNKAVTGYEMNDSVLSVNVGNPFAKNLTVATITEKGTLAISTYSLSYDNGYTAHKLYTTNDVIGAIKTTAKTAVTAIKGALGKLFSK